MYARHLVAHFDCDAHLDHVKKEKEEEEQASNEAGEFQANQNHSEPLPIDRQRFDIFIVKNTSEMNKKEIYNLDKHVGRWGEVLGFGIYPYDKTCRYYCMRDAEEAARASNG